MKEQTLSILEKVKTGELTTQVAQEQLLPIWNVSDNCHRALMFGFWKLHFTISYARG